MTVTATFSRFSGYCIVGEPAAQDPSVFSVREMERIDDPERQRSALSVADDWEVFTAENGEAAISEGRNRWLTHQCVSLVRAAIITSETDQSPWVYEQVEKLIAARARSDAVLSELLVAPYIAADKIRVSAERALGAGFAATGQLLHRLFDLQPLLRRFVRVWLALPVRPFLEADTSKHDMWGNFLRFDRLRALLEANDRTAVVNIFGTIAFAELSPRKRSAIARLGSLVANELFEPMNLDQRLAEISAAPDQSSMVQDREFHRRAHTKDDRALQRALREIDAIATAVSKGDDFLAERFLRDLVSRQMSEGSFREFAVKSLCNIAKQCADMFRTDFERLCLEKALEFAPSDSWTLIQMGDHLKRIGQFDRARSVVHRAISFSHSSIGQSLLADIASQEGNFEEAIRIYRSLPDWRDDATTRTAIADNIRRLGHFDEALAEYEAIDAAGLGSERTIAGRAEIAKRLGELEEAKRLYRSFVNRQNLDEASWWRYSLALAAIEKQLGELDSALAITEEVIARVPFAMYARVLRASIWGLLDQVGRGLETLSGEHREQAHGAFGEWVRDYTRGLLLLRSNHYPEAQDALRRSLESSLLAGEERTILRLASSLAYLADRKAQMAKSIKDRSDETPTDVYLQHLSEVLDYHVAVLESDWKSAKALYSRLSARASSNVLLWNATQALRRHDFEAATRFEVDAMLRIAA